MKSVTQLGHIPAKAKILLVGLAVAAFLGPIMGTGQASAVQPGQQQGKVEAAAVATKFNFGAGPEVSGYTNVSAADAYDSATGYGFNTPQDMTDVSATGSGVGATAVRFLKSAPASPNTFNVDLPKGLYRVQVMLGDTNRSSVAAEGVYQLLNLTGVNAQDSFLIPITDGQLNLSVVPGQNAAHTLSAMVITHVSKDPQLPATVWLGGDSTVTNYYPKDADEMVGWGQIVPELVNPDVLNVRNMASAGQIAKGFLQGGSLDTILKYAKPGDYFLLEMGINDEKAYSAAQFQDYMRQTVSAVKSTGATVVLVTAQGRSISWTTDENGTPVHNAEQAMYRPAMIALAEEQGVDLVDLNVLSSAYFTSIGPVETASLYTTGDWLHFNRDGATVLAKLVVQNLQDQGMDEFTYLTSAPQDTGILSSF
ncbi:esterase [Pseudarthrobacter sp. NamE2]|uniref:rhamnogalacturonan acetylesterase n=1 Tax=Pseudarthrobacter sp. NamE2 TaxID=2576838 RepID=UPI0010FF241C|nr:GDSL-type esterase/lipase family protein [Pseudarthrobacter sp. NamE2]TLM83600.1 esterase [Pseudarthrobacter sp. NamE2]